MTDDYYEDYDDEYGEGRSRLTWVLLGAVAVGALVWFAVIPRFQSDSVSTVADSSSSNTIAPATTTGSDAATDDTDPLTSTGDTTDDTTDDTEERSSAATNPPDAEVSSAASTTTAASTTVATTAADTTTAASIAAADSEPTSSTGGVSYPTLPDGSPVPVLGIFDTDTVTISGVLPSEDAIARLEALALANSKFPDAKLVSTLTVDPTIPSSVGVRVIEMNSVRFPESTADLLPEHLAEIDRAGGILSLFPNVSVLVIGHADQRGDEEGNFAISEERARNVSAYLVSSGIDPARVSSRAVGELDLLALGNDAQSFALNRRTEFVFYGLLTEPE